MAGAPFERRKRSARSSGESFGQVFGGEAGWGKRMTVCSLRSEPSLWIRAAKLRGHRQCDDCTGSSRNRSSPEPVAAGIESEVLDHTSKIQVCPPAMSRKSCRPLRVSRRSRAEAAVGLPAGVGESVGLAARPQARRAETWPSAGPRRYRRRLRRCDRRRDRSWHRPA